MKILKYRISLAAIFLLFTFGAFSQDEAPAYWIGFTDKYNNNYSISQAEDFLSQRAISRRASQGIDIDSTDLPVSTVYLDSLNNLGLDIRYSSKWLNGAVITSYDEDLLDTITNISFIRETEFIRMAIYTKDKKDKEDNYYDYGFSENQISMVNGHILHNQGFRGGGIMIAVLDAGFYNMPELSGFDNIFNENRILATRDYVDMDEQVYSHSSHGKSVMSILAGQVDGQLVGAAPEAEFLLIRTEDAASEQRIEEYNWAAGAEYADSLGADIINVSLGYKEFDLQQWTYDNTDTDGKTAPISIAASMAGQKGIVVSISAGNSGNNPDPFIGVPADADSVLTIGAVDSAGNYAYLSSRGYSADGRVKPDVVAQGQDTYYQGYDNNISYGSGTSYSSPIVAGMAACLWQANPEMTNMEIIQAIKLSASHFNNPTDTLGYGIPDFGEANLILNNIAYDDFTQEKIVRLFPNPADNQLNIDFYSVDTQNVHIQIFTIHGRKLIDSYTAVKRSSYNQIKVPGISGLTRGMYVLQLHTENNTYSQKFIKN